MRVSEEERSKLTRSGVKRAGLADNIQTQKGSNERLLILARAHSVFGSCFRTLAVILFQIFSFFFFSFLADNSSSCE